MPGLEGDTGMSVFIPADIENILGKLKGCIVKTPLLVRSAGNYRVYFLEHACKRGGGQQQIQLFAGTVADNDNAVVTF